MSGVPNVIIEEFHAGEAGLMVFYTTGHDSEIKELELSKHEAAKLMMRCGWLDDIDQYQDTVMVRFETTSDSVNHHGNHVQRVYRMHIEWEDYRSWVVEREVRDVVKLYLKDQNKTNGNA